MASKNTQPRGFSLLFVTGLVATLFLGAFALLQQVSDYGAASGATHDSAALLSAADAAALKAADVLESLVYPGGPGSAMQPAQLTTLPKPTGNDAFCKDVYDCNQWFVLPIDIPGYHGYTLRAAVTCVPNNCGSTSGPINGFLLRSQAVLDGKRARMLELMIEQSS